MAVVNCLIKKENCNIDLKDTMVAAKLLNGMAYKLYIYIASYDSDEIIYEKKNFIQTVHTTDKSVNKAFDELIEKHFLVQINPLVYLFNPMGENTINMT